MVVAVVGRGLSSNERFWPLSESAPNPPLTPLHVGHFDDKPNNSEREPIPNSITLPTHLNTIIHKHKKRAATAFWGETISILDMARDENWATASFDVLIVCVRVCVFLIPKKPRLIDGTKKKRRRQRGRDRK